MKLRNKKTGEIKEWECVAAIIYGEMNEVYDSVEYESLAKLNEDWEDYTPADPEIADETARETIRKWYNKNRIVGKLCSYGGESWLGLRGDDKSGSSWKIELHVDYFSKLINDKLYSLAELCGEEE